MKISLTVGELIGKLLETGVTDTEVWIKGNDNILCPLNSVEYDAEKGCMILREKRPFDNEAFDKMLKGADQ